ncbi:hypothetical protein GY45DRAFT_1263211 [Cubamyces sp. BRFM 1775]|nr:hypothetical protein GY45DRAFT_1263211 [Cubamyces sp. BRFM 1775]
MPDALTIALRKAVEAMHSVNVQYVSCATHPQGYDVFATKADLVRTIGVGDEVDLIYKRTQNGWFVAHRRSVQNEEQPEYVLLQVPRDKARVSKWPIWDYLRSKPWTQSTIPPPVGEGGNPIQVRASYSLRRFFEPERPDVQEIQALLDAFPCEFTVTLMDDKGQRREVLLGTTATGTSPLGGGHMDQGEEDSEAEEGESER